MIDTIAQLMIPFTGLIAVTFMSSQNPRTRMYGGLFGLAGEPFWFITAYLNNQWGVIILVFVYLVSWSLVVYKNWIAIKGE